MKSISRTVYPDGRVNEHKNGAIFSINKSLNTKEFNKWINFIHKKR
jgi:hypothetical protein